MWWKTLGVKPDADIETIKQAYSALIKAYRPEEHPEQFSQIRQAFELARKQARTETSKQSNKERQPVALVERTATSFEQLVQTEVAAVKAEPVRIIINEARPTLQRSVESITIKPEQEESIITLLEHWKKGKFKDSLYIDRVLNHPDTHDFTELKKAGHEVFAWLIKHIKPASGLLATSINMPVKELAKLNSLFGWSLKERDLYQQYADYDLSLVFFGIASGQSVRSHRNPIVMQKADNKQKNTSTLFEKMIQWGTGITLVYVFIMIISLAAGSFIKGYYLLTGIWCVVFYLLIDGLYYSFAGLKKSGILRKAVLTQKTRMWALATRQVFLGVITLLVMAVLEAIVLGALYGIMSAMITNKTFFLLIIVLPLIYIAYWLNKEVFSFSRVRYFKLIREIERIRLNSK
jgi:hypothetical protein